jgi:hypothetical protein
MVLLAYITSLPRICKLLKSLQIRALQVFTNCTVLYNRKAFSSQKSHFLVEGKYSILVALEGF